MRRASSDLREFTSEAEAWAIVWEWSQMCGVTAEQPWGSVDR